MTTTSSSVIRNHDNIHIMTSHPPKIGISCLHALRNDDVEMDESSRMLWEELCHVRFEWMVVIGWKIIYWLANRRVMSRDDYQRRCLKARNTKKMK